MIFGTHNSPILSILHWSASKNTLVQSTVCIAWWAFEQLVSVEIMHEKQAASVFLFSHLQLEMIRYRTRIAKNHTARPDMGDGQTEVLSFLNWKMSWPNQLSSLKCQMFKGDLDFQFLNTHSSSFAFREKWAHEKHPELPSLRLQKIVWIQPHFHFTGSTLSISCLKVIKLVIAVLQLLRIQMCNVSLICVLLFLFWDRACRVLSNNHLYYFRYLEMNLGAEFLRSFAFLTSPEMLGITWRNSLTISFIHDLVTLGASCWTQSST